ncbi:FBP1-like protein [Mya arenaria]|uniref:FBP1-like protein n=1 Tax=Mya arenaria TaxID=6604 RepID=A0ABY7GDA9_MYAAR|nr:FBP1-like protein [Mya arenaria]
MCADGWSGTHCEQNIDECESNPCVNDGSCIDGLNGYTCVCTDDIDDCLTNHCQNNGSCEDGLNTYTCKCAGGFNGTNCENEIPICDREPCQNGATCNETTEGYSCTCVAGFSGTRCEEAFDNGTYADDSAGEPCVNEATCTDDTDDCASGPCVNGATCTDGINSYNCTCADGWEGNNCTSNIDNCASIPCVNGATCNDGINSYSCTCAVGWEGTTCELTLTATTDDIQLEIVFDFLLEESANLTDPGTVKELTDAIEPPMTKHFQTKMGDNFFSLTITGFSRGSLKVNIIVIKKSTEQGAADFIGAALSVTDVSVVINNETYGASVSSIGNLKVNQETLDGKSIGIQWKMSGGISLHDTQTDMLTSQLLLDMTTQEGTRIGQLTMVFEFGITNIRLMV